MNRHPLHQLLHLCLRPTRITSLVRTLRRHSRQCFRRLGHRCFHRIRPRNYHQRTRLLNRHGFRRYTLQINRRCCRPITRRLNLHSNLLGFLPWFHLNILQMNRRRCLRRRRPILRHQSTMLKHHRRNYHRHIRRMNHHSNHLVFLPWFHPNILHVSRHWCLPIFQPWCLPRRRLIFRHKLMMLKHRRRNFHHHIRRSNLLVFHPLYRRRCLRPNHLNHVIQTCWSRLHPSNRPDIRRIHRRQRLLIRQHIFRRRNPLSLQRMCQQ